MSLPAGLSGSGLSGSGLSWFGILRLGLAQAALGSVAAIATATLNRVMVVELALPAIIPGLLVGLHYAMQLLRPRLGHAADVGGRRVPYIRGGMAVMVAGMILAAAAAAAMRHHRVPGLAAAACGYLMIGGGMGAMGTALLTLLADAVAPARRAAAATIVWIMMIAGSAVTAVVLSHLLLAFSFPRLLQVVAEAGAVCMAVTLLACARTEIAPAAPPGRTEPFAAALRAIWRDRPSRQFAIFVFASMLAYSGQELILEPFAGLVFHLPPALSARLSGTLHGGVIAGMILVAAAGALGRARSLRGWTMAGCAGSAACLLLLAAGGMSGSVFPLTGTVFLLGIANGTFAVSAVGAMMQMAGRQGRAGASMGLFGAAQAIAFASGGLLASAASDLGRRLLSTPALAYGMVFAAEAGLFLLACLLAARLFASKDRPLPLGATESLS